MTMFMAMLLVCHIDGREPCVELFDDSGPSQTEQQCVARVVELEALITQSLKEADSEYVVVAFKCDPRNSI